MLELVVLVDNKSLKSSTKADWGFSLFIKSGNVHGLFDIGPSFETLLHNADSMGISLKNLDFIFISHLHTDHAGDLLRVVQALRPKKLFLPASVSYSELLHISKFISSVKTVERHEELFSNIFSTGIISNESIPEQSMYIHLNTCTVVIVGCSHGGIINILKAIRAKSPLPILLVIGGLHIYSYDSGYSTGKQLINMGVSYVFPCHCTKDDAKEGIFEVYGKRMSCGVGLRLEISDKCTLKKYTN